MKYLKKFKNYGLSLTITQLMGLLVMCNIASCSKCSPETLNKTKLTVQVDQDKIQDQEKAAISFKNNGEQDGPVISLAQYTLQATISEEKGGSDSKIVYKDHEGTEKFELDIDAKLGELLEANRTELAGQGTQTINVGIAPGTDVTELAINLNVFEPGNEQPIYKKTISWTAALKPQPGNLNIVDITAAVADQPGTFSFEAVGGEVDPRTVTISWTSTASTRFLISEKESTSGLTLADVLGTNDSITEGNKTPAISWQVQEKNSQKKADISLTLERDSQAICTAAMTWNEVEPAHSLALDLAYDPDLKTVTYTVQNLGDKAITADDKLELNVITANTGGNLFSKMGKFFKGGTSDNHQINEIQALDSKGTIANTIALDFNHKPSIEMQFALKVKGKEIVSKEETYSNPDKVQLTLTQKKSDNVVIQTNSIQTKNDKKNATYKTVDNYQVTIANNGEVEIGDVSIKLKCQVVTKSGNGAVNEYNLKKNNVLSPGNSITLSLPSIEGLSKAQGETLVWWLEYNGTKIENAELQLTTKNNK